MYMSLSCSSYFFSSQASRSTFFFFSFSFNFTLWSARTPKSTILPVLFFLLIILRSCRLAEIRVSVYMPKSQSESHSPRQMLGCAYTIITIYSLRVFHFSVSWWSFTGVWVTASLLKSPGLFSVFCPFSTML